MPHPPLAPRNAVTLSEAKDLLCLRQRLSSSRSVEHAWASRIGALYIPNMTVNPPAATRYTEKVHLERIVARTRQTVSERNTPANVAQLEQRAALHRPRGFARALRAAAAGGPAILAEIKKASPSKGLIRPDFDPPALARSLAAGGAAALSVLTDEPFFQGSLSYLAEASAASGLPCLRKDFIVDAFQILEARAWCADAILLIAAALSDDQLARFTTVAHDLELDVLCEVHTAAELDRVRDLGCEAYGVNNRDLATFAVRLETSLDLADSLPSGAVHVSESGITSGEDIARLRAAGFHAFLIGESLMRRPDPGVALAGLIRASALPLALQSLPAL
jgi:indole-3-glycerol phosphate synthase